MIDLEFVRGLIQAVDESGVDSLEISRGGTRIRVHKTPGAVLPALSHPMHSVASVHAAPPPSSAAAPAPPAQAAAQPSEAPSAPAAAAAGNLMEIRSPMVGTFYRAPSPEAPPYVEVGSRVAKGQTLCILEAMKLMNELESELAGVVREVLIENGEPVEYGQVLFRVEPA
jgi:acetyl-CoA carboxylase biotin carboxyl carrier protein